MIVDFAIEDSDGILVIAEERLIASFEVDDFQAYGTERDVPRLERALLVRSPMDQRAGDLANTTGVYSAIPMSEPGNATQNTMSPFLKLV